MAAPAGPPPAQKNSALPLWAHTLRTEADDPNELLPQPEMSELRSLSHEGRVRYHMRMCVRPGIVAKRTREHHLRENEEQLLYVALYRDKIAEHQANFDQKSKDVVRGKGERRLRTQAAVSDTVAEAADFASPSPVDLSADVTGAEASASAPYHEAPATDTPTAASSSAAALTATGGPLRDTALPSLPERPGRGKARAGEQVDLKKASHIAAVTSAHGAGGVASEYLETKRLGKLFDEWKMRQEENVEEHGHGHSRTSQRLSFDEEGANGRHSSGAKESVGGRSGRHGAGGAGGMSPTSPSAGSPSAKAKASAGDKKARGRNRAGREVVNEPATPSSKGKGKGRVSGIAEADAEQGGGGDQGDSDFGGRSDYSDASDRRDNRISESKLVSRLFQVVSNPKVTGEVTGEGGEAVTRRVPNYVEGFPTLNLMRLYRGPWRLEC